MFCIYILFPISDPGSCKEGDVRLVNGTIVSNGRLEVCVNGVWGSVCTSGFTSIDGIVVCRQIGHNSG